MTIQSVPSTSINSDTRARKTFSGGLTLSWNQSPRSAPACQEGDRPATSTVGELHANLQPRPRGQVPRIEDGRTGVAQPSLDTELLRIRGHLHLVGRQVGREADRHPG